MERGSALSGALQSLRWGAFLVLLAALLVVVVPGLLRGFEVTMFGERAAVRSFSAWSLPALDVAFSRPPAGGEDSMTAWAAEQLAAAVYGLAVLVYYAGLVGLATGLVLIGVALHRLYRQADSLGR